MTKITLQITEKNQVDKTVTTKIPYINPQATDEQIKQFGQRLNALTDNTATNYKKITEVDL